MCDNLNPGGKLSDSEKERIKNYFKKIPSYNLENTILTNDVPALCKSIGFSKGSDQIESYWIYIGKKFGSRVTFNEFITYIQYSDDDRQLAIDFVKRHDKNGDGSIQAEEFVEITKILGLSDPNYKVKTFREFVEAFGVFVKEADKDSDGTVSVQECVDWIIKKIPAKTTTATINK